MDWPKPLNKTRDTCCPGGEGGSENTGESEVGIQTLANPSVLPCADQIAKSEEVEAPGVEEDTDVQELRASFRASGRS